MYADAKHTNTISHIMDMFLSEYLKFIIFIWNGPTEDHWLLLSWIWTLRRDILPSKFSLQFILVSVGDSERLMLVVGGRGVWDMWQRSVSSQHSWNHMCEPMEVVKTVLSKIWKHKETKTCTYYFKDCVMDMEVYRKSLLIWAFILMYRFSWVVFPLCVFSIFLLLVMLGN